MSDPFTLLSLPRRPYLTEEEIGTAYRKLAGKLHPDQAGGDAGKFRELGEATAILRNPSRRLRELAGVIFDDQIPSRAAEFFPAIATLLQQSDTLTAQTSAASTPLTKALLAAPMKNLASHLQATLSQIREWRTTLDTELQQLDSRWPEHDPSALSLLADSFAYAGRWERELRERELALASIE